VPAFHPKTFTNPDRLKSISAARLILFFGRWPEYFLGRGIELREADDQDFPYDEVAKVLMSPDESVPEAMVDALYYVHETASNDAMDELLKRAKWAGLAIETDGDPSTADLALQIWLQNPDLLQRQHAETVAFNRSRFMYFAGKPTNKNVECDPTPEQLLAMQKKIDGWMLEKRRGKASRVFAFPREKKTWFLVRHGEPMRREGRHDDDGATGSEYYRPQKHDVLIYDINAGELAVNAGTKGERELYLEVFGEVLFGRDDHFDASERFTLAPLILKGKEALVHETSPEIKSIRLIEIERYWGGAAREKEVRKATDLFLAWGDDWKKRLGGGNLDRAVFRVTFQGERKERTVTILPKSIARYDRDADSDILDNWLKTQGFCITPTNEGVDDDESVLEGD
jgi:hypothetical protein